MESKLRFVQSSRVAESRSSYLGDYSIDQHFCLGSLPLLLSIVGLEDFRLFFRLVTVLRQSIEYLGQIFLSFFAHASGLIRRTGKPTFKVLFPGDFSLG